MARSQGGLFGDRRRRRAKNEQNGSERTRLELCLCLTLPYSPRLASPLRVFVFSSPRLASPRLVSPRLALPRLDGACQLATRRQTRPSLSFVLMPTRLHASTVLLVVVFLFILANLNPRPSLRSVFSRRFGLIFRCHALAREPFRSPAPAPRLIRTRVRT